MRPGAPPPRRRRRAPLGPTPRYAVIPRWGLGNQVAPSAQAPPPVSGAPESIWTRTWRAWRDPSELTVRATLRATEVVLVVAALAYAIQYLLLIINRIHLLHTVVSAVGFWFAVVASVAAIMAVILSAVTLTQWLIQRRAAAFTDRGQPETRSVWALRFGCLVPLVNLLWAPVYVIELATLEERYGRLRLPIRGWWIVWAVTTAAATFATATRWVSDAQGIANNTAAMAVTYLLALITVRMLATVLDGFGRSRAALPAHRWVVVADDRPETLESVGSEPAA